MFKLPNETLWRQWAPLPLRPAGAWRWLYVVGAVTAQYLNVLVLIVQSFGKVPALKALPPGSPAFVQLTMLTLFIVGGVLAVHRFPGLSVQPS
jgi:hypothetical protein